MPKAVTKAIFPVAGLGTRFLPVTKALPKEMLPVVDKPLIQYAVEEARAAGVTDFIFPTFWIAGGVPWNSLGVQASEARPPHSLHARSRQAAGSPRGRERLVALRCRNRKQGGLAAQHASHTCSPRAICVSYA